MSPDHDPLRPHRHDPNLEPPPGDGSFRLVRPDGESRLITPAQLRALPQHAVGDCYIVSTGHGTSGPFTFEGVTLLTLIEQLLPAGVEWEQVEVLSTDGFGNRVSAAELRDPDPAGPILLALAIDGVPMSRAEGLVRMIVPSERDDALRQVKWIGTVRLR